MTKLFSLLSVGIVLQLIGVVALGQFSGLPIDGSVMLGILTLLPHFKLNIAFAYADGWLLAKALGKKRPGGLPIAIWITLAIMVLACAKMIMTSNDLIGTANALNVYDRTGPVLQAIFAGLLFSILWSVVMWFAYWKNTNRLLKEYDVRIAMKQRNWKAEKIERRVAELRADGFIA